MSLTVHITIPRREWEIPLGVYEGFGMEEFDRRLGSAIRQETARGIEALRTRATVKPSDLTTIEITLVETARANFEENPEAHLA